MEDVVCRRISENLMAKQSTKPDRVTLSAEDWEREALELIAEKGVGALAVEPLAKRMGITKGSFYWHFPNRESLLDLALQRWEEHDSRNLGQALGEINDPRTRLIEFFRRVSREQFTHDVYSALFCAADHPQVEPLLERVADRRMNYLGTAYQQLGFDELEARQRARLAYTAYMGFLQLQRQRQAPSFSSEEFDAYVDHVIETLIPG